MGNTLSMKRLGRVDVRRLSRNTLRIILTLLSGCGRISTKCEAK